jgi:hypothetical protein
MNKYIRGTIFEIPAVCIFLLVLWMVFYNVGMLIEHFTFSHLGKWGFILTFPITWPYIYVPLFEKIMELFDEIL